MPLREHIEKYLYTGVQQSHQSFRKKKKEFMTDTEVSDECEYGRKPLGVRHAHCVDLLNAIN